MGQIASHGSRNVVLMYFGAIIGFVNTILLYPKILPKDEYGLIQLVINISMLLAAISSFGTPNALIRFFPHFRDAKNNTNGGLVKYLLVISGVVGVLMLGLMVVFKEVVTDLYSENASLLLGYYYYILPVFFMQVFLNLLTSYLNVIHKSHIQVIQKEILLRIGQTILIVLYYFGLIDIEVFMPLFTALFVLSLIFMLTYLKWIGELKWSAPKLPDNERNQVWQFSVFTFLSGIARQISFRIDSIMVGALVVSAVMVGAFSFSDELSNRGLEAVSIYAVALNMSSMLEMPFRALNQSLAPSISKAWAEKDLNMIGELYQKSTETMMAVGVYMAVGIWACVDQILEILPPNYAEVKYVLGWLILGKLLNVVAGANGTVMMNSPKFKVLTVLSFFGLLLTVASNYLFIAYFQIEGAAMATFVTYVIMNLAIWFLIVKYFKLQPFTVRSLLILILGIALVLILGKIGFYNMWVTIIFKAVAITGLFWGVVYFANLSPEVNSLIKSKLLSRLSRR